MLTNKNIVVFGEYHNFSEFYDECSYKMSAESCKRIDDWLKSELDPNDQWATMDWCSTAIAYLEETLDAEPNNEYFIAYSYETGIWGDINSIIILQIFGGDRNDDTNHI